MKKVIVTGSNGFLGSALCKELSLQGVEVVAVVRNEEENIDMIKELPHVRIVYCDMSDFCMLSELVKDRNIDVLYHFAWIGSAGVLRSDANVQISNIVYACDTVKIASELGCKKIVFASSIMEYEIQALMETDATPGGGAMYSTAKIAADYMSRILAGDLGVEYVRAVISNIYGPGETSPRLINTSIRKLMNGEHCSFSSGEQIYDFIYIDDAARIFVELGRQGLANKTYYIGSLKPRPLKEFLCEMRDQINPNIILGLGEIPFNGISLSYQEFDVQAVKKDTGYVPQVEFTDGINRTIRWIKEKG